MLIGGRQDPQKCHFLYLLERPLQQSCTTVQTVIRITSPLSFYLFSPLKTLLVTWMSLPTTKTISWLGHNVFWFFICTTSVFQPPLSIWSFLCYSTLFINPIPLPSPTLHSFHQLHSKVTIKVPYQCYISSITFTPITLLVGYWSRLSPPIVYNMQLTDCWFVNF